MLRILEDILDCISDVAGIVSGIERFDRSLADQLRRSSTALALNVAEAIDATGRSKSNSFRNALREMRESVVAIEIARRMKYVKGLGPEAADRQDKIVRTLSRLLRSGPPTDSDDR